MLQGVLQFVQHDLRRGEKACGVLITAVNPDSFNETILVDILLRALNVLETIVDALDRELVDAFTVAQGVKPGTNLLRVAARTIREHVPARTHIELRLLPEADRLEGETPRVDAGISYPHIVGERRRDREQGREQGLLCPAIFKLSCEVTLIKDPVLNALPIQHIANTVGRVGSSVAYDVVPEEHVVNQGRENVLALIGQKAGLGDLRVDRHNAIELAAVVADVVEGLTILIFRVVVRKRKSKVPKAVDLALFLYAARVFGDRDTLAAFIKNLKHITSTSLYKSGYRTSHCRLRSQCQGREDRARA